MLYLKHNIYDNLVNAKDNRFLRYDIINDEIAKLIVYDTDNVISALESSGLKMPKKPSLHQVRKTISNNLVTNSSLQDELIKLIIKNNPQPNPKNMNNNYKKRIIEAEKTIKDAFLNADGEGIEEKVTSHEYNYRLINGKQWSVNRIIVVTALTTSALWVLGYIVYKFFIDKKNKPDMQQAAPQVNQQAQAPIQAPAPTPAPETNYAPTYESAE